MRTTGYLSPEYVESLAEFGRPLWLPGSGGSLLVRTIPGTDSSDAMGPYPLFCCQDWSALPGDFDRLENRVVSVVVVTDPFAELDHEAASQAFNRGLVRYKDHHVIDLDVPLESSARPHHRRNARRALERLAVEEIDDPPRSLDIWCGLYDELIKRHGMTGISCFSRRSFEMQWDVPGLAAFRAVDAGGAVVGMVLWYCQGAVGYYHLAAYSERGYTERASYALFWAAAERLRGRVRWLSLGAGAGATRDASDGLTRFKRGWSPLTRPTYLGRHVACERRYAELRRGRPATQFFPAYRDVAAAVA